MKTNITGKIAQEGALRWYADLKGYLPETGGGAFEGGVVLIPH